MAPLTEAWDWRAGEGARPRSLSAGEAIYDVAPRQEWTAEAWSDLDLIRIRHASGRWWWLTARRPRKLAWAGGSLLATLLPEADVMRFAGLTARLEADL